MLKPMKLNFLCAIAALLCTCSSLMAQLSTVKIEGVVRDKDTGNPIQGAQVSVEGTRLGNVTNTDGYYFILSVPPGRQAITFTYTGYQKLTIKDQLLLAGQTATVNANLSSTVVEMQGITIEGESEILVPRDNTVTKQRLTATDIAETPATRLEDMMVLQAGVQIGGRDAAGRGLRIRGGRLGEEGMVVDGIMVRNYTANPFANGASWVFEQEIGSTSEDATPQEFSVDAVEQVDIITGGFQAEYGNVQSGIINIVTKEGGPDYRGSIRFTTDEQQPRTSDWGYNQVQASIGGPVPLVPNMYFQGSGEIQGQADRTPTHADEGFRGVNQDFVDRMNESIRNDSYLSKLATPPYNLDMFKTGHAFYASKTGVQASLFSPGNPVRLPGNWGDRTLSSGKITYSPVRNLKLLVSNNWTRNQMSYPWGWSGEGNYFQSGVIDRTTDFYNRYISASWENSPYWAKGFDRFVVPQSFGRRSRTNTTLLGADWFFWQNASRSANLQFRYMRLNTQEINSSSLRTNYERDTFLSWSPHDIQFEVETYPNKENPLLPEKKLAYLPNGNEAWLQGQYYETAFAMETMSVYYLSYRYLKEQQDNYKVDLDFQMNRTNRAKIGYQYTGINNDQYSIIYSSPLRDPRNEFHYKPPIYAAYVQNRTDLGDFVFNYGLRYDGFQHNANWGLTASNQYGDRFSPHAFHEWSPRFDVGFPVTDKSQLRFSYGVFSQLPTLALMFDRANPGGLEYSRTDAFESGLSYLVNNDLMLDIVAFYRDVDGNVAQKTFFRDYYAWHEELRSRDWIEGYTNRDNGNIKGVDFKLAKRFSKNYSYNLMYTLQFSRTTGSAYNSSPSIDASTNEIFTPPDELRPIDGDRTHKFTAQFNYLVPQDFKAGTVYNKILANVRGYALFTFQSGEPLLKRGNGSGYTKREDAALTSMWDGYNFFRGRWYTNMDIRLSKAFRLGRTRQVSVFGEVFNLLNRRNNAQYPTYGGYEQAVKTQNAGLDLVWDDLTPSDSRHVLFNSDFNGDGILSRSEAVLGAYAESMLQNTMDKRIWGTARQIRMGIDFSF